MLLYNILLEYLFNTYFVLTTDVIENNQMRDKKILPPVRNAVVTCLLQSAAPAHAQCPSAFSKPL